MDDIAHILQQPSTLLLAAILAAALLLAALLKVWFSGPPGDAVLLVGPCDAGKTTLFLQLRDHDIHSGTVASMSVNEAAITLRGDKPAARPVRIIDIPGHPRLRARFEQAAAAARGIVFLVDSVDFMPRKAEAAEQLYDVLSHPAVASRSLPVLLACNKADAGPKAHSVDFIRKRLEREIDQMRSTRGTLGGDAAAAAAADLGVSGEPFTFAALAAKGRGPRVETASVSAIDAGGVDEVGAFIRRCVPA